MPLIAFLLILIAGPVQAQDLPPAPLARTLTSADSGTILKALEAFRATNTDTEFTSRLDTVEQTIRATNIVGRRETPIVGLVLSRASKDPAACALLQEMEPRAVCVK